MNPAGTNPLFSFIFFNSIATFVDSTENSFSLTRRVVIVVSALCSGERSRFVDKVCVLYLFIIFSDFIVLFSLSTCMNNMIFVLRQIGVPFYFALNA